MKTKYTIKVWAGSKEVTDKLKVIGYHDGQEIEFEFDEYRFECIQWILDNKLNVMLCHDSNVIFVDNKRFGQR